jgi:hypothetical protein
MRYFRLLALLALFIPTFRITAEEVSEPAPAAFEMADAIQPRNEGALWLYTSKMYDNGTWEPAGSSREDVQEVVEIDGVKCYKVQLTIDWRGLMDRLSGQQLSEDDYSYDLKMAAPETLVGAATDEGADQPAAESAVVEEVEE